MQDIPKIVITGGPCAGKTTALAAISERCQELGFTPVIVPEAATNLIASGFDRTTPEFQEYILRETLHAETLRLDAAAAGQFTRPVFIYDRGLCDGMAYTSPAAFEQLLAKFDLTLVSVRDHFSGVIFLQSAAFGAEEFYTTENNVARIETIDEARVLDIKTRAAWFGTPHLVTVENRPGQTFERKIHECLRSLARILGIPEPLETERKFLLKNFNRKCLPEQTVAIDIIQTYLVGESGRTERVRARGQHNRYLYFHTIKEYISEGVVLERDRLITLREYNDFLIRRDMQRLPVFKTRHCFVYDGHYCELDVFHGHRAGLVMLEIEVHDMEEAIRVPPFLDCTEVTGDSQFSNFELASPV